jgi:hypothetical protein
MLGSMEARKVFVKRLKLFEPVLIKKTFRLSSKDKISYSIKQNNDFLVSEFNHFAVVAVGIKPVVNQQKFQ